MTNIRAIAICVFRHADRILVIRASDPQAGQEFLRPFRGGIEFGEPAADALVREISEELGEAIDTPRLLGVLDNCFDYADLPHHEHVFVSDSAFRNREIYMQAVSLGRESGDQNLHGEWVRPSECEDDHTPLYPQGVHGLLRRAD